MPRLADRSGGQPASEGHAEELRSGWHLGPTSRTCSVFMALHYFRGHERQPAGPRRLGTYAQAQ